MKKSKKEQMTFDQWMFKVVEHITITTKREQTEIYCSIDLFDAKLQFLDGVKPEDFDRGL